MFLVDAKHEMLVWGCWVSYLAQTGREAKRAIRTATFIFGIRFAKHVVLAVRFKWEIFCELIS